MASSKVMTSSNRRNSDLTVSSSRSRSRRASAFSSSSTNPPQPLSHSQQPSDPINGNSNIHDLTPSTPSPATMTVDGILRNVYAFHTSPESTLLDAQITLIDTSVPPPQPIETAGDGVSNVNSSSGQDIGSVGVAPQPSGKTVEEVWREIVAGRKEMKEEEPDEMMTLEDFLAKAGAVDVGGGEGEEEEDEVKMPQQPVGLSGGVYAFDPVPQSAFQVLDKVEGSIVGFGNGVDGVAEGGGGGGVRGKRGRAPVLEPLDKAAEQRQKRMIKNRESAARSRERKQAYQVELESLAVRLEEENEQLLREKEERSRERFKQLMEKVVPVVEKQRPPLFLRRVRSWQW